MKMKIDKERPRSCAENEKEARPKNYAAIEKEVAKRIFAEINELRKQYARGDIDSNTLYVYLYAIEKKYTEGKK